MNQLWVVNASPIILLAKIGQVHLLEKLPVDLVIPKGVVQEISQGAEPDSAKHWLAQRGKIWVREIGSIDPKVAAFKLGLGETQVISYALTHPDYLAIVDDRAARNCALALRVPVRGTLGVLLLAKRRAKIIQVKSLIQLLQKVGLRIDQKLVAEVIKLAGENPHGLE
jgi:predicted nucleic acid-binding protein